MFRLSFSQEAGRQGGLWHFSGLGLTSTQTTTHSTVTHALRISGICCSLPTLTKRKRHPNCIRSCLNSAKSKQRSTGSVHVYMIIRQCSGTTFTYGNLFEDGERKANDSSRPNTIKHKTKKKGKTIKQAKKSSRVFTLQGSVSHWKLLSENSCWDRRWLCRTPEKVTAWLLAAASINLSLLLFLLLVLFLSFTVVPFFFFLTRDPISLQLPKQGDLMDKSRSSVANMDL